MALYGTRIHQQCDFLLNGRTLGQGRKGAFLGLSSDCLPTLKMLANICVLNGYTAFGVFLMGALMQNVGSWQWLPVEMIKVLQQYLHWNRSSF